MLSRRRFIKGVAGATTTAIAVTVTSSLVACGDDDDKDPGTGPGGVTVTGSHDASHTHSVAVPVLNDTAQSITIGGSHIHTADLSSEQVSSLATAGTSVTVTCSAAGTGPHTHQITFTSS